jgi:hypothetical protein
MMRFSASSIKARQPLTRQHEQINVMMIAFLRAGQGLSPDCNFPVGRRKSTIARPNILEIIL